MATILAMRAFLEGDLSLLGSSISLVHSEAIRKMIGADYVIQSVGVNPSSGAAAFISQGWISLGARGNVLVLQASRTQIAEDEIAPEPQRAPVARMW
jgi:hypothetical protein